MSTLAMPVPVQTDGPDLATHLPELRMMLEEQRRFRIDQLHIHDGSADEHHVDVLDTSADNARVEVDATVAMRHVGVVAEQDLTEAIQKARHGVDADY